MEYGNYQCNRKTQVHGTRIILSTSSNIAWDMITVLFAPAGRRENGRKVKETDE